MSEAASLLTFSGAGWLVLLTALGLAPFLAPRQTRWPALGLVALVLAAALAVRFSVPYTPLHANNHAYEDIAVALALPDASELTEHFVHLYGPSWWAGQRLAIRVFGAHHEGLALGNVVFGALAVLLAFLAAFRAGAGHRPALVAALALVAGALPVAARVGHSESPFAVAQFLVASVLLLAGLRGRVAFAGYLLAVGLLATGHLVGPLLALAAVSLGWAVAPRESGRKPPHLRAMAGLALVALLGLLALHEHAGAIRGRLDGSIVSLSPLHHLLWLDPDWSSLAFLALALLGPLGLARRLGMGEPGLARLLRAGVAAAGLVAGLVAGQLILACVSDGLRYQAPLAPLLLVSAGAATRVLEGQRRAWRLSAGGLLLLVAVVELARLPAGFTRLDVQARQYHALRAALAEDGGPVAVLVAPPRPADEKVLKLPVGPLSHRGPSLLSIPPAQIADFCARGLRPRVFIPAEAGIARSAQGRPVAELLRALVDEDAPRREGAVPLAPYGALQNEFFSEMPDPARWLLAPALCP